MDIIEHQRRHEGFAKCDRDTCNYADDDQSDRISGIVDSGKSANVYGNQSNVQLYRIQSEGAAGRAAAGTVRLDRHAGMGAGIFLDWLSVFYQNEKGVCR